MARERRHVSLAPALAGEFDAELRLAPGLPPPDWPAIFGRRAPLVVEIGSGNGAWIAAEAAARPEADFVGIERSEEFFAKLRRRIEREGLRNARCACADVGDLFPEVFPAGCAAQVVANFSDPWPKRRHRLRRVFQPGFFGPLERVLAPGGEAWFKTDVGWYFNLTICEFRRRRGWRILEAGPAAPRGALATNFEQKARATGGEVWAFRAAWDGAA